MKTSENGVKRREKKDGRRTSNDQSLGLDERTDRRTSFSCADLIPFWKSWRIFDLKTYSQKLVLAKHNVTRCTRFARPNGNLRNPFSRIPCHIRMIRTVFQFSGCLFNGHSCANFCVPPRRHSYGSSHINPEVLPMSMGLSHLILVLKNLVNKIMQFLWHQGVFMLFMIFQPP